MYARENVTWMVPEEQVISYFCPAGHGYDNLIDAGWTDEQIKIKILTVTAWFVQNPAFTLEGGSTTPETRRAASVDISGEYHKSSNLALLTE